MEDKNEMKDEKIMEKKFVSSENVLEKVIFDFGHHIDLGEFLCTLFSNDVSIDTKKFIWHLWCDKYYSFDVVREFFSDTLFKEDGDENYLDIMIKCEDYNNFYELALSLDMGNFDPTSYYIYWILTLGNRTKQRVLEDAIEYDSDKILGLFPDIKEVIFEPTLT